MSEEVWMHYWIDIITRSKFQNIMTSTKFMYKSIKKIKSNMPVIDS